MYRANAKFRAKTVLTAFCSMGLLLNILMYQNCSVPFEVVSATSELLSTEPPPPEPGQMFVFSGMAATEMKLASQSTLTGTLNSLEGFSGSVNLSIDRSSLNISDFQQNVRVEVQPSTVFLSAGGSVSFSVIIATDDMAPSFNLSSVKLNATDPAGVSLPAEIDMNLKVQPVVELRMNGSADPLLRWDRPSAALNFRNHSSGLTVRFINVDADSDHVVHGNGAIQHGPVNNPMVSPAIDGQDGGVYEVVIANGTIDEGSYYYHDLGPDGDEREMFFGVTSSSAALANLLQSQSPAFIAQLEGQAMPADTPGCAVEE